MYGYWFIIDLFVVGMIVSLFVIIIVSIKYIWLSVYYLFIYCWCDY